MAFKLKKKSQSAAETPKTGGGRKRQFIFFIGDEGAMLVHMQGKRVLERIFAPMADDANTKRLLECFGKDPKAPISVLVDMIDQSYVRHSFPPVTSLSVGRLVERRLERDFAPDDIKGAIALGRDEGPRKDWNFLLISLPYSQALAQWVQIAQELPNRLAGIYLVPVEAQNFVARIGKALPKADDKAKWQLLVSHNRVGGFRQVVFKEGKLVFTRLAQPLGEMLPEVIAGNIEQEVQNTIEYIKRLSYMEQDGLDVYVVAAEDVKNAIDPKKLRSTGAHLFAPHELAQMMGLEEASTPSDRYGDIVFASTFGLESKRRLKLHTPYTKKLEALYGYRNIMRYGAAAVFAGVILYSGAQLIALKPIFDEIDQAERKKSDISRKITGLREQTKVLPENIDRITDVVDIYEILSAKENNPLEIVEQYAKTLEDGILVEQFNWTTDDSFESAGKTQTNQVTADFKTEFSRYTDSPQEFRKFAERFFNRVTKQFPDYDMTRGKLPGGYGDDETIQYNFAEASGGAGRNKKDVVGVPVTLKGPIPKQEAPVGKGRAGSGNPINMMGGPPGMIRQK